MIIPQRYTITQTDRERLNQHPSRVIWFTGLSGSGKSTVSDQLEVKLHHLGYHTFVLDGDNLRDGLNKYLGFSEAERAENIRRAAEVAKLMSEAGLIVITSFISPFRKDRELARSLIGENFFEVFMNTPIEVCEQRDPKGLYKKARSGAIKNMTGITSPYEVPLSPDVTINVGLTIDESVDLLINKIIPKRS